MKYLIVLLAAVSTAAFAAKTETKKTDADPKTKRQLSFDNSQLVEGEIYRPDYAVVTGENPGEGWGVLRLRKNLSDKAATDNQEKKR